MENVVDMLPVALMFLFKAFLLLNLAAILFVAFRLIKAGPRGAAYAAASNGIGLKQFFAATLDNTECDATPTDKYIEGVSTRYVDGKMMPVCEIAPTVKSLF